MNNKLKSAIITLVIICGVSFGLTSTAVTHSAKPHKAVSQSSVVTPKAPVTLDSKTSVSPSSYQDVRAVDVVANASKYLNKRIRVRAKFDKFSILGLDYKPAFRSSEKYISFLIKREDVTDHTIPLSEMKIFLPRTEAEKHIDLDEGDEIEFSGLVFSNALGDVWVDVEDFKVLTVKNKDKKSTKK
jgi:hypothetical protein